MTLPPNEYRRKYFSTLVDEASLLFNIPKAEATVFAERFVTFMSAKIKLEDTIHFGNGVIVPKVLPPRTFNLIDGKGPSEHRKTHYGERTKWKINLFKRAKRKGN